MKAKIKSTNLSDDSLMFNGYKLFYERPIEDDTNPKDYISNMPNINDDCEYVYKTRINHHSYRIIKIFFKKYELADNFKVE